MTTKNSSERKLREQASKIAIMLKKFERGAPIDVRWIPRLKTARERGELKFAVVMDDKTLVITMSWQIIHAYTTAALEEFILGQMQERTSNA